MKEVEEFISNINVNKEVLETMPKNNSRDLKTYITKLQENLETAKNNQKLL